VEPGGFEPPTFSRRSALPTHPQRRGSRVPRDPSVRSRNVEVLRLVGCARCQSRRRSHGAQRRPMRLAERVADAWHATYPWHIRGTSRTAIAHTSSVPRSRPIPETPVRPPRSAAAPIAPPWHPLRATPGEPGSARHTPEPSGGIHDRPSAGRTGAKLDLCAPRRSGSEASQGLRAPQCQAGLGSVTSHPNPNRHPSTEPRHVNRS
jgi:hypothetical protein